MNDKPTPAPSAAAPPAAPPAPTPALVAAPPPAISVAAVSPRPADRPATTVAPSKAPTSRQTAPQPLPFYKVFQRQTGQAQPRDEWPAEAFWYTVLFLGCASVALMLWGAYSALPRPANPEKSLRAEHVVPKLKGETRVESPTLLTASAEPPLLPLPGPSLPVQEPTKVNLPPVSLAPLPAVEPVSIDVPRVHVPLTPQPVAPAQAVMPAISLHQEPLVYVRGHSGDTPMLRTWKTLTLYSLIALAPAAAPAPVVAQDDPKLQTRLEKLEELIKRVNESLISVGSSIDGLKADMKKDIAGLNAAAVQLRVDMDANQARVKELGDLVGNLRADVTFLQRRLNEGVSPVSPIDKAGVDDLRRQLNSIEQAIARLRAAEPPTGRIALSPPSPNGKVILANMYNEELLFVINQRTHRVPPGAVQSLENVPAGTLTYEVLSPTWGLRARNSTNLPANETFTLTAR